MYYNPSQFIKEALNISPDNMAPTKGTVTATLLMRSVVRTILEENNPQYPAWLCYEALTALYCYPSVAIHKEMASKVTGGVHPVKAFKEVCDAHRAEFIKQRSIYGGSTTSVNPSQRVTRIPTDECLTTLVLPNVIGLGAGAVANQPNLSMLILGPSIVQVDTKAVTECPNLTAVYIGNPAVKIADGAFPDKVTVYKAQGSSTDDTAYEELSRKYGALESEKAALEKKLVEANKSFEAAYEGQSKLGDNLRDAAFQHAHLKSEYDELKEQLTKACEEKDNLAQQLAKALEEKDNLAQTAEDELAGDLKALQDSIQVMQKELEQTRAKLKAATATIEDRNATIAELQKQAAKALPAANDIMQAYNVIITAVSKGAVPSTKLTELSNTIKKGVKKLSPSDKIKGAMTKYHIPTSIYDVVFSDCWESLPNKVRKYSKSEEQAVAESIEDYLSKNADKYKTSAPTSSVTADTVVEAIKKRYPNASVDDKLEEYRSMLLFIGETIPGTTEEEKLLFLVNS